MDWKSIGHVEKERSKGGTVDGIDSLYTLKSFGGKRTAIFAIEGLFKNTCGGNSFKVG